MEVTKVEAIKYLGLTKCEFNDECDYCNDPEGESSYCAISSGEGYTETDYYICEKCLLPFASKRIKEDGEFAKYLEEEYEQSNQGK